jgi:hypothetical protein
MGLEITTYIDGLNDEWPTSEDFRREGDDHLRLIKGTLLRTFPNVAGEVTLSHNQLNALLTYVADVEGNLISGAGAFPAGGIILWSGTVGTIPTGWALCDGTNGTPDLRDKFVVGAGGNYTPADAGGTAAVTVPSSAHSHAITVESHALSISEIPSHAHPGWKSSTFTRGQSTSTALVAPGETGDAGSPPEVPAGPDTELNSVTTSNPITRTTGGGGGHSHGASSASVTIASQELENRPPYYALAYIMKLATTPLDPVTPPGA